MQKKIRAFMEKHQMIQEKDRIIVGVSGGADSVCLFWSLMELKNEKNIELLVVHVNHMIRGEEANEDEVFVKELCRQQNVACRVFHYPIPEIAKKEKISMEEAGRKMRYQAFEEVALEWHADKIALAHHRNDCAETMLYYMARGTGIGGLCSLRPVRNSLIRPLLCMNREEIEQYLEIRNLTYRTDSTNQSEIYTRNKIRHQIVPQLQQINEKAVEHMAILSEELEEINQLLEVQAAQLYERLVRKEGNRSIIAADFKYENPYLVRMVILQCLEELSGTKKDFSRIHIQDVYELPQKGTGKRLNLPYGVVAACRYGELCIYKEENEITQQQIQDISLDGDTKFGEYCFECRILEQYEKRIPQKSYTKWIDYDKIKTILTVRNRMPGDFIVINEQGGKKKLKDYLIDQKIPREERDQIIVVADGSEIVWIVGYRLSHHYLINDDTKKIVQLQIKGGYIHE